MLSLGTWVLLQHPASWEALRRGEPAEVDRVVQELLRFVCPVQMAFPRIARREVSVGDQVVHAGDIVLVSLTGAERDPARHVDPEHFDPTRATAGTLAFGHGLHRCVGAELARMELRTALVALSRRFPDLALACDPADLRFTELAIVHGVERLPVRLW
jgi:cytochrome P450